MALNIVTRIDDPVKIDCVLASVYDKTGLDKLIPGLIVINPQIMFYSTGGTFETIKNMLGNNWKKNLTAVSDYTGQPEMQGGLVKTLDFKIYLGLLSETYNDSHKDDLKRTGAVIFDMLISNLYPFNMTISKPDATVETARANIDIGGPAMIRASAKNFHRVAPLTDPCDYDSILDELKAQSGMLGLKSRFQLARKAFKHTAAYDAKISEYLFNLDINDVSSCYTIINK